MNTHSKIYKSVINLTDYKQIKCKCILPLNPFYKDEYTTYYINQYTESNEYVRKMRAWYVLDKYRTDGDQNLYYINIDLFNKHFIDIQDNREQLLTDLGL